MRAARRQAIAAALVLVIATNAIALAGVAFNRRGEPDCTLTLTERELALPFGRQVGREDSGLTASLRWRVLENRTGGGHYPYGFGTVAWLDAPKLTALGFSAAELKRSDPLDRAHRRTPLPREVLVVLELDGAAYAESVARTQKDVMLAIAKTTDTEDHRRSENYLDRERTAESRLFAIDAGLDAGALRTTYPDRHRYAIVRSQVQPAWFGSSDAVGGALMRADRIAVNVPRDLRDVFGHPRDEAAPGGKPDARYEVRVAFGQRLEPWLLSAERR